MPKCFVNYAAPPGPTSRKRKSIARTGSTPPGLAFLALAIGALQMMLDRGESFDWFASREVIIEGALAGLNLYLFVAHIVTDKRPFIDPELFRIAISRLD